MPYCKRCGVEITSNKDKCPLCGEKLIDSLGNLNFNIEEKLFPEEKELNEKIEREYKKDVKVIWSIFGLIFSVALFILLVIMIKFPQSKSWIFYPISSIIFFFLFVSFIFFFYKRIFLLFLSIFLDISFYLLFLDLSDRKLNWFFSLGLPLIFSIFVIFLLFTMIYKKIKNKGWNVLGLIFLFISLICLSIDFIVSFYSFKKIDLIWSPFVLAILVPISLYFFYLQYGARKKFNIDRFFHID